MEFFRIMLAVSLIFLIFMVNRISHAQSTRSRAICSMIREPVVFLTKDASGYRIFNESQTEENTISNRRMQASSSTAFKLDDTAGTAEIPETAVRKCPCALNERFERTEDYYCEVNREICEVTLSGRHICWSASVAQFVGNLFPFVFFWFGILVLALFWTQLGRNARAFLLRKLFPCFKESHEQALNRELDELMVRRPENVMSLVRSYGRRIQRSRRARVRRRRGDESRSEQDQDTNTPTSLDPQPSSLLPSLVLKTKIYHEDKENIDDDEENLCTICLNPIEEGMRVGSLPCTHIFHADCLKSWLKRKNQCPLCNEPPAEFRRLPHVNNS